MALQKGREASCVFLFSLINVDFKRYEFSCSLGRVFGFAGGAAVQGKNMTQKIIIVYILKFNYIGPYISGRPAWWVVSKTTNWRLRTSYPYYTSTDTSMALGRNEKQLARATERRYEVVCGGGDLWAMRVTAHHSW